MSGDIVDHNNWGRGFATDIWPVCDILQCPGQTLTGQATCPTVPIVLRLTGPVFKKNLKAILYKTHRFL